jgi:hypothetical protein
LEGRTPREARFDGRRLRAAVHRSPSRSESTSEVAPGRHLCRLEKRHERRGPEKGTAGREEQGLEGRTPWTLRRPTGHRQARPGENRQEGRETLKVEDAGAWKPRENRIGRASLCRRGQNPGSQPFSRPSGRGRGPKGPDTSKTSQAQDRYLERTSVREQPARKSPRRSKPRGGSAEPNRRYGSEGPMECRSDVIGVRCAVR